MKSAVSGEQRFVAEIDALEFVARDMTALLGSLDDWLAQLTAALRANRLACAGLEAHGALARQADAIDAVLRDGMQAWSRRRDSLAPARALAGSFGDVALLLVFGKFNAGKSSFCNFLADRFAAHGKAVRYFHVDAGRVVETLEPFTEGTTETTSRLQGVRLGGKLVLLDTPGLHSVTPENAALTQRCIDGADGVLWLTSSTSPGQVRELDDLGRELRRNKPLLPVVTRSDVYEEDEADGEIVKRLCNKTAANRALQEADVHARAQEKLRAMGVDAALLRAPVSVSAHMAREQAQTPAAMAEAGFDKLYAALLDMIEPALAYKRRKLAEIALHHLEEEVLGLLAEDVAPRLAELDASLTVALGRLDRQRDEVVEAVWRRVAPALPEWLERHAASRDVSAICDGLSTRVFEAFCSEANARLADYVVVPDPSLARIERADGAAFDDIAIDHAGPNGPMSAEVVGVDYGRLHAVLRQTIRANLLDLADSAVEQCRASLQQLEQRSGSLRNSFMASEGALRALKRRLRTG